MTEVAPRPRPGGRSARVRVAVLDATLDLLTDEGYAGLTVAKVADRAGVHRTAVYRRWPSPGALLAAALLDGLGDIEAPDTGDLGRDLLSLSGTMPRPPGSGGHMARAVAITRALDAAGDDPEVAEVRGRLWERRVELVRHALARAESRGEIDPGLDPELVVDVLFGAFHTRVVARGRPYSSQFARDLLALILH